MRLKVATLLAGAFLFLTVPAFASPTGGVFCAGQTNGSTFSSLTVGGVTATAWSTAGPQETLVCKIAGSNEMGLGISGDEQNEIDSNDFIQLTLAGIPVGAPGTLTIESVQGGESFSIFGSDTNGVLGTVLLGTATGGVTDSVTVNTGNFNFLDVTAPTGNVLLDSFTTPTPEPGTYLLMGTGLLMLGFLMRRKFASAAL